jgi:hypothetical protein
MKNSVECEWSKKNKEKCGKESQFINDKSYCNYHYVKVQNMKEQNIKVQNMKEQNMKVQITWTNEMNTMFKSKKLDELKNLLKLHKLKISGNKRELIERIFEHKLDNIFN